MPGRLVLLTVMVLLAGEASSRPARAGDEPPDRRRGVVLYADRDWRRAFVLEAAGHRPFALPAEAVAGAPDAGRLVEVAGSEVRDLGPAALPDATPLAPGPPAGLQWVSVEGTVRAVVPAEETRTYLRVHAGGADLDVHVPFSRAAAGGAAEPGARLRLRGVVEPATDAWSRPRLWVADWSEAVVTVPAPSWEGVGEVSIAEARKLARAGVEDEIRVAARAAARRSVRSFTVSAGEEAMTAELEQPDVAREHSAIEIRGFLAMRHDEPVIVNARWRTTGTPSFHVSRREDGLPVLTRVEKIRALSRAEAERGYPVRVEGVATYVSASRWQMFVQDETGGVYVHARPPSPPVAAGERVRVQGFTGAGGLAALVVDPVVTRLGPGALPAAPRVTPARLSAGFDDCRRVETTGYVRRVRRGDGETELLLGVEGHRVPVHLPVELGDGALPPVDARVRVTAVCGTSFNWRGLFDHVELFAAAPADVVVEERPADPFQLPLVPVRDLLRSNPSGRWERLVRTRGVVLHHRDGQPLFLRSPSGTVVAETSRAEPLLPGDEVDVVGFPATGPGAPRLEDATFRRLGPGPPPVPVATSGPLLGRALEAELARLSATLLEVVPSEAGTTLVLQTADAVLEAHGEGDFVPEPPKRSTVEVTGVLLPHDPGTGSGPALHLVLRSPADVRVVARPPWLTSRRATWTLAGLAAAALLALAWVGTLRRQVAARTAELASAEERYRLLADNASDVIVTTDPQLRLTYVSPSVTRDSGYSIEEALSMPLERVVTPDSWATLRKALERAGELPAGEPVELYVEMVRKDGSLRFMHVRTCALRDATGALVGFRAAARDITARRQAQQEVARLATAIEQSADAIVLTDPEGTILYVNPAFQRVTGYAAEEVLGGNPAILKSGVHDRTFYETMWATLGAGRTWEGRFTNRRKDGRLFLEDASISPVREGAEGRLIGYVAVKRDVTRQVQLEGQLAQAQKMEAVGRLAAGIAHDFNNVLAIILSMSDLALQRGSLDERTQTCISEIREAALRAGGLTRQILTFSRQSPSNLQPLEPRGVVAEAAGMLRHVVPAGVEVRPRLVSTVLVAADATQLHQVVLNLGTNAGLAMRERGGTIDIELEDAHVDRSFAESHHPLPAGPCLRLVVRDQGYGMRPEILERIFEPFFTTRAPRDGTGMGLAVVHGIVHNHGGAITVESALGRGSSFCVYLPALRPPAPGEENGAAAS